MNATTDPTRLALTHGAPPPRVNVIGIGIMPLTMTHAIEVLDQWRRDNQRDYVCCISVHGVVTAQRDPEIRSALNGAGLATEDGMPLVWACRRAGYSDADRVCGPDLMAAMCALSAERGYRHYFYGGAPETVAQLARSLSDRYPGITIAGYHSPPFRALTAEEEAADIATINAARPDFVWVGLGMPKQEKWMVRHVGKVEAAALIGVGAAFDFHAGTKQRAPRWLQRTGFEWVFRLASEPRRLARRYLIDNTIFVFCSIQQQFGARRFSPASDQPSP